MAEIPVERKSGSMAWLWIILALILLALVAWWLLADDGDDAAVDYNETETAAVVAEPVATDDTLAIGESVDLDNVTVTSLAGDMAFNAEVNGEPMLVLFNQTPTPGTATEGEYDINPGSLVNITGSVRSAESGLPENVTAEIPAGTEKYIFADTIEMVS